MERGTLTIIAKKAGVSRQCISAGVRSGFGKPTAKKLAELTGVDINVFLFGPQADIESAITQYAAMRQK
jgi:hypothetical protein